jgi:tRNA-dihydrouridine synthase B
MIGLAPMDGVTDAAFRYIVDKYGRPDMLFTEFVSAKGINQGIKRLLPALVHHETKTPTVAQVFGSDPDQIYKIFFKIAAMGFNGMDINMGCPDKSVTKQGGGAALIL